MKQFVVKLSPAVALAESQIDDVLADSFPASDPPSWTSGGAEIEPEDPGATNVADVPTRRSSFQALTSLLDAAGFALLVPLFVVLFPLALIYRLMLAITGWPSWLPHVDRHARQRVVDHGIQHAAHRLSN